MASSRPGGKQRRLEKQLLRWLTRAFEAAGWKVDSEPSGPQPPDLICRGGERAYAVELRALDVGARMSRLQELLADALLRSRAAAAPRAMAPLAIVAAERLSRRMVAGLEAYVRDYAEGAAWGVMDARGLLELDGPNLDSVRPAVSADPDVADAPRRIEAADPFSDLGQWVVKVLLARRVPMEWLDVPRGPVHGVGELAERAGISATSASRLVSALMQRGFIDASRGELRLVRVPALLESWRGAASRPCQELRARFLFPAADPAERLEKLVAGRTLQRHAPRRVCLGLFSACKVLGLGWVRGAPLHLYSEELSAPILRDVGLHPVGPGEEADLVVRKPRFPESVFRGAVVVQGRPVADALQCWLDVSSHPSRGAEQAQEILHRLDLGEDGGCD